jgi:hypothetical protein
MGSRFHVDGHVVEVATHHWSGDETYRVDGVERLRRRHLGWHTQLSLPVGDRVVQIRSRWYPLLPVEVWVDDQRWIDDLFPQVGAVLVILAAPAGAAALLFALSIARDLWGILALVARASP